MDWLVVRFWETDIKRNLVAFVDQIERLVALRKACI
jgi:very-short-patch-repair endonuclease